MPASFRSSDSDMLPPEILDQIFSFLTTDKASLKACSSTHPVFLQLVQPYYYADVAVSSTGDGGSFQAQELLTLLSEKPQISNYILHLKISIPEPSDHVALNTISTILHLLVRLTSIHHWQPYGHRISWNKLPESFLMAFMTCLRLPSMEVVSFANIRSFPLTTFDNLPNIKTIRLINVDVVPYWDPDIPVQSSLQVLSFFDCEGWGLTAILSWAKTRHLHSLEFRPDRPYDLRRIIFSFQTCFNSLTSLDLDFKDYFQTTYRTLTGQIISDDDAIVPLHLAGSNNLERVTVHALATVYDAALSSTYEAYYSWSLPAIVRFFESASSPKHITLNFRISIYGLTPLSDLNWSALDLDSSSMLQHIDLRVSATAKVTRPGLTKAVPPATILSSLSRNRHLKGLVEKGFLTIEPHIYA